MILNVGVMQITISKGNKAENYKKVEKMVQKITSYNKKIDIILLPELWSTGYALDELNELASPNGIDEANFLKNLSKRYNLWIGGSVVASVGESYTNRFFIVGPKGKIKGTYDKVHLFRLMNEDKFFTGGRNITIFDINNVLASSVICYDIRFCELVRKIALAGAKVLFVSAEWPVERIAHWKALLMARAIENQMFVISSNSCGIIGTTTFGGHSLIIDPWGKILHEAGEKEEVFTCEIDINEVSRVREIIPIFQDRVLDVY